MITTIIFDLSEVYLYGLLGLKMQLQVKYGISLEKDEWWAQETRKLFHAEITEEIFWHAVITRFKWDITIDELKEAVRQNFKEIQGTRVIIEALKKHGYRLGLLSIHAKEWVEYCQQHFDYHKLFDSVIYSFEVAVSKPDKKAYEQILTKLQVNPEECIFIDDQPINLRSAEELGIKTIQFISAKQLKKELKNQGIKLG